jgi:hypothetical protein
VRVREYAAPGKTPGKNKPLTAKPRDSANLICGILYILLPPTKLQRKELQYLDLLLQDE